jgi:Ca2+/Na+ antiporter
MKPYAWIIAVLAAIAFVASLLVDTRFAPLVGAVLLAAAIGYAMWINKTDRKSLVEAERATREHRREKASGKAPKA